MKKPLFSALYIITLFSAGFSIHQAFAQRSPSVEPITEIAIEDSKPVFKNGEPQHGFDFASSPESVKSERVPASFASKPSKPTSPYSYLGPIIFLIALPISLWVAISKKMKNPTQVENSGFYPKNLQFRPNKSQISEQDLDNEDHEDNDFPKAS